MPTKLTLALMRETAGERGGKCLSATYTNNSTKLEWECAKGHRWWSTPASVHKLGTWCPECAGNLRLDINQMRALARERGGVFLTPEGGSGVTLPPFVRAIYIQSGQTVRDRWIYSQMALTPTATTQEIERTINAKDPKVAGYGRPYHETWLLIHSGFGTDPLNVARFLPEELGTKFRFSSRFSKVFLFSSSGGLTSLQQ